MSRHKSLSGAMSALMAYKGRPEGAPSPVQTNWALVASNDNEPELVAAMPFDRKRIITPSIEEMARHVNDGEIERDERGALIRVGKLRFSDGEKFEAGFKYGPGGDVVSTRHRMPPGAMLGSRDKLDVELGNGEDPFEISASNSHFAEMFGVEKRQRRNSSKRRNGDGFTRYESESTLATAYGNTPVLPKVKICPPGLPAAGGRVSDSFLGMKKSRCADSGGSSWQDVCTALVDREIWSEALSVLSDRDRETLDEALKAPSFADIGRRRGHNSKYSIEVGKRAVIGANDNLDAILKKVAS